MMIFVLQFHSRLTMVCGYERKLTAALRGNADISAPVPAPMHGDVNRCGQQFLRLAVEDMDVRMCCNFVATCNENATNIQT